MDDLFGSPFKKNTKIVCTIFCVTTHSSSLLLHNSYKLTSKVQNGIYISKTEWFIRLSSYQKYLKQTHKEMDDLFGAPFIKKIYNEIIRIAQLDRRRGSLENGRKHDVKDHAWDAHKQGLKMFLQMYYYHVGNAKPEFRLKEHLQISRLRFNNKINGGKECILTALVKDNQDFIFCQKNG